MKRRPTVRSIKANLAWFWRWKIVRYLEPPLCVYCGRSASVYHGRAWFCQRHPLLVPSRALGRRPCLCPYTRSASDKLFQMAIFQQLP